jgi:2-amino-4-hydroxy-6-hydroxymethyldihydropteridine diphosphokinase
LLFVQILASLANSQRCLDQARHDKGLEKYASMRTAVALGSNLGDRLANLRAARQTLVDLPKLTPPILSSSVYETEPIGCEPGAPNFLNAVVEFEYSGEADELMEELIGIEESLGRERRVDAAARRAEAQTRRGVASTSRTIDLDLLYSGDHKIDLPPPGSGAAGKEGLQLPHPRLHLRRFVLQPLADIRPDLILPNQAKSVRELLAQTDDSAKVVRLMENW